MIGNVVKEQLHAAPVHFGKQRVEVRQRAEYRIDVGVVGDIVAEVRHRRRIDR
jgi:hypothetical protein